MALSNKQIDRLVKLVFKELKDQNLITFKAKESQAFERAVQLVKSDFDKEKQLDAEVHRMMDDLEQQNPGEFQRYKMFPLLKKRLAKEKGIIL